MTSTKDTVMTLGAYAVFPKTENGSENRTEAAASEAKRKKKRNKKRKKSFEGMLKNRSLDSEVHDKTLDVGGSELSTIAGLSQNLTANSKKRKRSRSRKSQKLVIKNVAPDEKLPEWMQGEKTVVSEVITAGKAVVVTITKEGSVVHDWILRQGGLVFGLDAEWRPSFVKGIEHKIALLQICGELECLIVQMLYVDVIPEALITFLREPSIMFPGVGVTGDAKKLQRDWGLQCRGAVDLTSLAAEALGQPELKQAGLKTLAQVVIGFEMAKPKRVTMSNWAKPVLDKIQVEYACLDAWVAYAIYQKLVGA